MDVYFIFIYLMNFKKENMNHEPIGCRETNYSKNTIMYCGFDSCLELPDKFNFFENKSI